ncbi:Uncharacterised protein [Bacteroides finegoldii]|uniref:Uncharacterized protein n=1 Tax=Bacteroides finegoldii TaxID=338188 RepID=A0A174C7D1_9BACE|nr:Uncharacterised protein [Bacteroides finegoldii]
MILAKRLIRILMYMNQLSNDIFFGGYYLTKEVINEKNIHDRILD